jgi:hypothetical protein
MPDRSLLSHEAFGEALDRYGHDLEQWPARLRPLAENLLASSDRARHMMAEAEFIAEALSRPVSRRASPDLIGRIMHQAGVADPADRYAPQSSAKIIRPDWSARRQVAVAEDVVEDKVSAESMPIIHSDHRRYLAVAAIVAVGLLLGWSSGPLTLQDNMGAGSGAAASGLAAYLSL